MSIFWIKIMVAVVADLTSVVSRDCDTTGPLFAAADGQGTSFDILFVHFFTLAYDCDSVRTFMAHGKWSLKQYSSTYVRQNNTNTIIELNDKIEFPINYFFL